MNATSARQFVILTHNHPFLHWDFFVEQDSDLASWRLLEVPETGKPIPAEPLPAHRKHYLKYEGPVSGDRGYVRQLHLGTVLADTTDEPGTRKLQLESNFAQSARLRTDCDSLIWYFE